MDMDEPHQLRNRKTRRPEGANKATSNDLVEEEEDEGENEPRAESVWKQLCKAFAVPIFMISTVTIALWHQYGIYIFMSSAMKEASYSQEQVTNLIASKSFLFVGGPHRGGTTILWQALREHPNITGFSDKTGADASEGIFIQSVFPQFGIGAEISAAKMAAQHNRGLGVMRGLGKYAFAPEAHMTEEHHLATERHRRKLFNQFAYFWDVRREDAPVLLEKSPPNMVYSRFIQKMFSADLDPNAPKDIRKGSSASFVFVTRHPIANALAHQQWTACQGMTVFELVLHWVHQHELMAEDLPHLERARAVRFEEFAAAPRPVLDEAHAFVGLRPHPLSLEIKNNTNQKYEVAYCKTLLGGGAGGSGGGGGPTGGAGAGAGAALRAHRRMARKLNARVLPFGYDLNDFGACQVAEDHVTFRGKVVMDAAAAVAPPRNDGRRAGNVAAAEAAAAPPPSSPSLEAEEKEEGERGKGGGGEGGDGDTTQK